MEHLKLLLYGIPSMTLNPDVLPHACSLLQLQYTLGLFPWRLLLFDPRLHFSEETLKVDKSREFIPLSDHFLKHGVLLK